MHPVSIFGAVLGLGVGTWLHGFTATLIGGAAGFAIMFGLYMLGSLFARGISRLRGEALDEDALGFGDVNLTGILGLILGWPGITMGLVFAILLGGLVSGIYMLAMLLTRRFKAFTAIPYGPFLIAGAMLLIYFRTSILELLGP
jgi:leader peptidase (prepilin peptidase)/N-methyltransferase